MLRVTTVTKAVLGFPSLPTPHDQKYRRRDFVAVFELYFFKRTVSTIVGHIHKSELNYVTSVSRFKVTRGPASPQTQRPQ